MGLAELKKPKKGLESYQEMKIKKLLAAKLLNVLLMGLGLVGLWGCTDPFAPSVATPTAVVAPPVVSPSTTSAATTPGQATLTTVPATITRANGQTQAMMVELARTPQEQETGLMGRPGLPPDRGMLFIFPQPGEINFWMKDTPLALSIAFIDTSGKILSIQDMQPYSEELHSPGQKYIYALEVPKGYFADKNIRAGDTFTFKS